LDQDKTDLRLKLQNVHRLAATANERKGLYKQLRDLADEEIASSRESLRVQVKAKGVKHVTTAVAHYSLGAALLQTHGPMYV